MSRKDPVLSRQDKIIWLIVLLIIGAGLAYAIARPGPEYIEDHITTETGE